MCPSRYEVRTVQYAEEPNRGDGGSHRIYSVMKDIDTCQITLYLQIYVIEVYKHAHFYFVIIDVLVYITYIHLSFQAP